MKLIPILIGLCIHLSVAQAQEFPFDSQHWEVNASGSVFEMFEGKPSLYMYKGQARLKDFEFFTGVLEYDIYVTERRGFPGIQFRIQDEENLEEFYIRPHQSGKPDANQYNPVFNGLAGWQLYFGPRFSTAYSYDMNAWNHIKLVIAETRAEVFINDMEQPLLVIPELKHAHKSGDLGFQAGGPSAFRFANLKVTKQNNPTLKSKPGALPVLPAGIINNWSVSNPFSEASLKEVYKLSGKQKSQLTWQRLQAEERGYANLSRVTKRSQTNNTVFAKVTIYSDRKQVKKLSYGASDRGIIFLNDEIITSNQNNYASQDYRHLGTIGFFDDAYLYLKKGKNELWIGVSENFGGWGVMARIEDQSGIRIE